MQPSSSPISHLISHLKPYLSQSDFERAEFDLTHRESRLKSERDEIARQFENSVKNNVILSKELDHWKREHGALLLGQHETKQELNKLKLTCERLNERLEQESGVDLPKLKQERDEFESKFVKAEKDLQILKKQCGNLSQENGDLVARNAALEVEVMGLKGEVAKVEEEKREAMKREKEAREMCKRLKEGSETAEKYKTEELEKTHEKKREAEGKLEVVMIAATDRYKELELRVKNLERDVAELAHFSISGPKPDSTIEAEEQKEKFGYDEVNKVLVGCPSVCETIIQESAPCTRKSTPVPPPIFEITDDDDDDDEDLPLLEGNKRKLFSSEASNEREQSADSGTNRSKQLKGSGDESVNASTPLAVSVGSGTDLSLISNMKQNPVALKQCEKKFGVELDRKHQSLLARSAVKDCKDGIQDESGYSDHWEYEADMLDALERDTELCMKAVCALYRQQTAQGRAIAAAPFSGQRIFNHCSTVRIATLAKFLVNGDKQWRLKRSVAELEKFDPKAVVECRSIACSHGAQLFEIYQKKADPFFAP